MVNIRGESPLQALLKMVHSCMAVASRLFVRESSVFEYEGVKDCFHIYLLIGQSNMVGQAPFTEEESGIIEKCFLFNGKDKWEPAKNPLNRYSTIREELDPQKMSPGYTFTKTMLKKDNAISIGLVANAKRATSINQWMKGSAFYQEALRRTRAAQKTGTLKGILWHQGETDVLESQYLDKLKVLIDDLRRDLGEPDIPFVAGEINDVKLINDQIKELPGAVPFTGFTSSDGLECMDRWHFDAKSIRLLGQRYAEEILKIRAKQKAEHI